MENFKTQSQELAAEFLKTVDGITEIADGFDGITAVAAEKFVQGAYPLIKRQGVDLKKQHIQLCGNLLLAFLVDNSPNVSPEFAKLYGRAFIQQAANQGLHKNHDPNKLWDFYETGRVAAPGELKDAISKPAL